MFFFCHTTKIAIGQLGFEISAPKLFEGKQVMWTATADKMLELGSTEMPET